MHIAPRGPNLREQRVPTPSHRFSTNKPESRLQMWKSIPPKESFNDKRIVTLTDSNAHRINDFVIDYFREHIPLNECDKPLVAQLFRDANAYWYQFKHPGLKPREVLNVYISGQRDLIDRSKKGEEQVRVIRRLDREWTREQPVVAIREAIRAILSAPDLLTHSEVALSEDNLLKTFYNSRFEGLIYCSTNVKCAKFYEKLTT